MKCMVCGTDHPKDELKIIQLTADEIRQLLRQGQANPEVQYIYCRPCWRTLSNPERAPQLMKGVLENQLRRAGVSPTKAATMAEAYHRKLIKLKKENYHGPKDKPAVKPSSKDKK